MAITPLPTPPSSSDPANFNSRADAFLAALAQFVTEANALGTPGLGGGSMLAALNFAPSVAVASAATCDIGAAASNYVSITGAVGITSFGTTKNAFKVVTWVSTPTVTNGANLVLLGAASKTYAAGAMSLFISDNTATPIWTEILHTLPSVTDFVESKVDAPGSTFSAGSGNAQNLTSISLGAGEWDIEGLINTSGATLANMQAGIHSTSATQPSGAYINTIASPSANGSVSAPRRRFSLTATTTIYLVFTGFGASTPTLFGYINARRVR